MVAKKAVGWQVGERKQKWLKEKEWELLNFIRQYSEVPQVQTALKGGLEKGIKDLEIEIEFGEDHLSIQKKEEIHQIIAILRIGLMKMQELFKD